MKTEKTESGKRLFLQTGGLFSCPYEWCIVDFVYWRSNTQLDRRWTCRMKHIQHNTPAKRIETITDVLDRMCGRSMGFSKVPFGKPQHRRCGKGLTADPKQSYQYIFDAKVFDEWLKSEQARPIPKRIDPYPRPDSMLSESGQKTYPKADTKRTEELDKKEIKEDVLPQPSLQSVAPKKMTGEELAEAFDKLFPANFIQGPHSSKPQECIDQNQAIGSQPPLQSVAGISNQVAGPFQSPIPLTHQRFSIL